MDYKEQENDIDKLELNKDNDSNSYMFLVQKLKNISENIDYLENNFLDKEI
tara:strand:+ start:479 stop:631 length:153 start_codon:yes stop_codon:yes gene_type:complete